tara:strand:+ start:171 stop:1007 length:837 start_codon:yes stop_codon:yes gene_type:complete
MNNVGFMQGRLVDQIDGKIQAFPTLQWEEEFETANQLGISLMEWTIDDFNFEINPLMTKNGREKINFLCKKYNLKINSLTADCVMQAPFWLEKAEKQRKLKEKFISMVKACHDSKIKIIVLPIVDNGSINDLNEELSLRNFLIKNKNLFEKLNIKIAFESDLSPKKLLQFINKFPESCFGINYDIGNSASLGFDTKEEIATYGSRILNVHVKDRVHNGSTVPLGNGNADFELTFNELNKIHYKGDFILQTARAEDNDHSLVLKDYFNLTTQLIKLHFK